MEDNKNSSLSDKESQNGIKISTQQWWVEKKTKIYFLEKEKKVFIHHFGTMKKIERILISVSCLDNITNERNTNDIREAES